MPVFKATVEDLACLPGVCTDGIRQAAKKFGSDKKITMVDAWLGGAPVLDIVTAANAAVCHGKQFSSMADHTNKWAVNCLDSVSMDTYGRVPSWSFCMDDVFRFRKVLSGTSSERDKEVLELKGQRRTNLVAILNSIRYVNGPHSPHVMPYIFMVSVTYFIGKGLFSKATLNGCALSYFKYMSTEVSY